MLRRTLVLALVATIATVAVTGTSGATPIDCQTAEVLERAAVKPVWFPYPQPAGYTFRVDADAKPSFVDGLIWRRGKNRGYLWLVRVPRGANVGDPEARVVARPSVAALGRRLKIVRLGDGRLFAEWPTRGRYPDVTAAVTSGHSVAAFTTFLRSLRRIAWPSCPYRERSP